MNGGRARRRDGASACVQLTEETGDFQPPLPTVRFRDRWLDPNYVDAHEMENGEDQVRPHASGGPTV